MATIRGFSSELESQTGLELEPSKVDLISMFCFIEVSTVY